MKTTAFDRRLEGRYDELKWLYCELYHDSLDTFHCFVEMLRRCWGQRKRPLRAQDARREADPDWYRRRDLLGMMLYVDAFAGDLAGVRGKLDYIRECGVNYLHLMPLLQSPKAEVTAGTPSAISGLSSRNWALWTTWRPWRTTAGSTGSACAWTS